MYEMYARMRDARGLTDYRVAKETGLGRATLSDWKTGLHKPGLETLKKIADFFGVTIDYFVSDQEQK